MICYVYDGSFDGLLTAIYNAYYRKEKPEEILRDEDFTPTFLTEPIYIETDIVKSAKVYNAILEKISHEAMRYIFYVFLSELKDSSTFIYKYIKLGFNIGKDINLHVHNDIVLNVQKTSKRVINERHRMIGFVRFKFLGDNLYYAPIEPEHNVLQLIIPHFSRKFSSQRFVIHDKKREIAAVYNKEKWIIAPLSKEDGYRMTMNIQDDFYEKLWKEYFKSASIENRKNSRLQKRCMPQKYWKYLVELG